MTTIYIVTSGAYSEYTINAVFSTKELAKAYIDAQKWWASSDARIEEYPLDQYSEHLRQSLISYQVHIAVSSSNIFEIKKSRVPEDDHIIMRIGDAHTARIVNEPYRADDYLCVVCWAKDEHHAAKIAMKKRAAWVANRVEA